MPAADTNVVLRLVLRDDEAQYLEARRFLDASGHLFVSHVVLAEVVGVLASAYRVPKSRICDALVMLIDVPSFTLQDLPVVKAALDAYRGTSADFSDCLVLASARAAGELPLATFDAKLSRLEGTRRLGRRARGKKR